MPLRRLLFFRHLLLPLLITPCRRYHHGVFSDIISLMLDYFAYFRHIFVSASVFRYLRAPIKMPALLPLRFDYVDALMMLLLPRVFVLCRYMALLYVLCHAAIRHDDIDKRAIITFIRLRLRLLMPMPPLCRLRYRCYATMMLYAATLPCRQRRAMLSRDATRR